jgi:mRNA interferase RelE/StbE
MIWKIEIDPAADLELDKLNRQAVKRILKFLHERIAPLEDPWSIGEPLKGS